MWQRVDITTADTPTAFPPEQLWHEVISLVNTLNERDRARDVAVRLEQELAHLSEIAGWVTADLLQMHSDQAIDLDQWPWASELVQWAQTVRQP